MDVTEKIAVYSCENSGFLAAGSVRDLEVMSSVEIIKLPCSGKNEVGLILKSLEKGYAGVLILGCPKDNCKFIRGSHRASKRVESAKEILTKIGLNPECVRMEFLSSVDDYKFTAVVRDMWKNLKVAAS
jgi:F420-non-reducing hydrogenase iron-sulfur subunit